MIHMVGKSIPRFTKAPSLVLIGLVLTEIQAFKNVKYLQRNVWKTKLRKADRTVGVNCNIFSNISSGTA